MLVKDYKDSLVALFLLLVQFQNISVNVRARFRVGVIEQILFPKAFVSRCFTNTILHFF